MKYAASMVGILLSVHGLASAAACSDTLCSGQISVLYASSDRDVYVGLVGGLEGLTGCIPTSGAQQYVTLSASSANVKLIYATLLAAQMTGRPVTIAVIPGSNGCIIRYVTSP